MLQSLIDVPCSDLAAALDFSQQKTQVLQDTLQRMLDRKEEERQSKDLLRLYLKAMEQEEQSRNMFHIPAIQEKSPSHSSYLKEYFHSFFFLSLNKFWEI